jgi:hypothetical protein
MRWAQSPRGARAQGGAVARRQGAHRWTGCDKVLGSSTTAKRRLRRAIELKAGFIEVVGRQWGGGEWSAWRRSGGGRLRRGGGGLGGSLATRGGGEGELWALCRSGKKSTTQGGIWPAAAPF